MPELPEVETIARALSQGGRDAPSIVGETIVSAELLWPRTLATLMDDEQLNHRLAGQKIQSVGRRGKFLVFDLSRDVLMVHLRMSGDMRVEPGSEPLATHDRFVLYFESGLRLAFNDPRKFGRVWLVENTEDVSGGLGYDPFDEALTPELFYELLHKKNRQLKPLLLDQTFLAGLGNIYTDEALFLAGLHPLRIASSLSINEAQELLAAIRTVLEQGIQRQGASIDWVYRGGDFQNYFKVYQRTGEPCLRCGTKIARIVVGQRGTHYCPHCQPL